MELALKVNETDSRFKLVWSNLKVNILRRLSATEGQSMFTKSLRRNLTNCVKINQVNQEDLKLI